MNGPAAVAAGHPDTARAAADVLADGGNAFDAAVAAGFASAVAEPALSSLGGGGFLVARTADGAAAAVDFFTDTPGRGVDEEHLRRPEMTPVTVRFPGADQVFHAGWGSVAVPGCLDGYLHVHAHWGRLPLAAVVAPAAALAAEGALVTDHQAAILTMLAGIVGLTDDGRRLLLPGGVAPHAGDRLTNPQLADVLADIGAGRLRGWADPALAVPTLAAMAAGGGLVTEDDLAGYAVADRDPLTVTRLGATVATNPAPAFGGGLLARALAALGDSPAGTEPAGTLRLAKALRVIADHDDDPDEVPIAPDDPDSAAAQAGQDHRHARPAPRASRGTTHISVLDGDGTVVAMTVSNGSCSGVFVPGTGIHLNNMLGEADLHPDGLHPVPPGLRVRSMMAPTILATASGLVVGLGSGGSQRIRSAVTQAVVNLVDRELPLAEAVAAPRMHWDGSMLQAEPGLGEACYAVLRAAMPVNVWPDRDLFFGGVHTVASDGSAAADERRGGHAITVP